MAVSTARFVGNASLALSLLAFAAFFFNVLLGGPLDQKPWMSDVVEMLTLFLAVIFFVAGTLAREAAEYGVTASEQAPESKTPGPG